MKSNPPPRVIFYEVSQNSAKIGIICQKAIEVFTLEKKLLFTTSTLQAAQYVDDLLWRFAEESFLPHVITDHATVEWIAITLQDKVNVNGAIRLFNLCPTPAPLFQEVTEIFEFYDKTDSQKTHHSQQRHQFYQSRNLDIQFVS